MKPVQAARAPWSEAVFICRKCCRKAHATAFRKEVKRALKAAGAPGRIRVVETSCLDLCPKKRIAMASGAQLARGRLLVASPNSAAKAVAALLATQDAPERQVQAGQKGTREFGERASDTGLGSGGSPGPAT